MFAPAAMIAIENTDTVAAVAMCMARACLPRAPTGFLDGVVLGPAGPARPAGLAWRVGLADGLLGLPAGPLGLVLGPAGALGLVLGLGGAMAGAGIAARP